ncbi:MAG TPA: hypothetical protein VF868_02470 [Bacteroidia bacterium]|jgi:hypothetical protein
MKNIVKSGVLAAVVIAFASCQKTEFNSVAPVDAQETPVFRVLGGESTEGTDGNLLSDRDKCKKCHTAGSKTMGLDLNAPFMPDNRYGSIEELVNNFDFVNNVHLPVNALRSNPTISEEQKAGLISYLKSLQSK